MKKIFCIRNFNKSKEVEKYSPLIVGFKKNDELTLKNLTCDPKDRMNISIDPKTDEVVIRFRLFDNEFLSIGEDKGMDSMAVIKRS